LKKLIFSSAALSDIDGIWDYSAENWSVKQANTYVNTLRSACRDLVNGRRIGQSAHEIKPDHFRLFVGSHTIYYRFDVQKYLIIERVLHQSMDVTSRL
jgi:toxin ParE1/3/4